MSKTMPKKGDGAQQPMSKWLKTIRSMYGLQQAELAQHIGKSRSAIGMYESGRQPVPVETIALLRSTFTDAPPPPSLGSELQVKGAALSDELFANIRYAGVVPCSTSWGDPLSSQENRPIEPKFAGRNRFLCKVVGDSCYPALQQGDLTVWERDTEPPYGVIVLAERLEDQACTVKELQYDPEARRNRLVPINPAHQEPDDGEGWTCTARLIGVLRQTDGPEKTWYWPAGLRARHLSE